MRRILLLLMVWCYAGMAMAIPDYHGKWRTEVWEERQSGDRAWWAAWNSEGQLSSERINVRLERSSRNMAGFCGDMICIIEKKYILTISSYLHQEKIAIMTREKKAFSEGFSGSKRVLDVDVEGEKVVGDFDSGIALTTLRFAHWDRRVLMNIEDEEYGGREHKDRRITLTIVRSDGHPFQWLGHEVEMVTLSANLFPAQDAN